MRICATCGKEISAKRLAARPSATLCTDCQQKSEQSAPRQSESIAYFRPEQVLFGKGKEYERDERI